MCCLDYKFGIRFLPKNRSKKPKPKFSVFIFQKTDWFLMSRKPKFFKTEKPNRNIKKNRMSSSIHALGGWSPSLGNTNTKSSIRWELVTNLKPLHAWIQVMELETNTFCSLQLPTFLTNFSTLMLTVELTDTTHIVYQRPLRTCTIQILYCGYLNTRYI